MTLISMFAYVGPGGGIALIGSLVMLIVAVLGALGFVLLWPLRALFQKAKGTPATTEPSVEEVKPEAPTAV